jgi:hypothetical protein
LMDIILYQDFLSKSYTCFFFLHALYFPLFLQGWLKPKRIQIVINF